MVSSARYKILGITEGQIIKKKAKINGNIDLLTDFVENSL